jgi:hypothetical protein
MAAIDTYSKRLKRRQQAGQEDVFGYDFLPESFRIQVVHIWRAALGEHSQFASSQISNEAWEFVQGALAREFGVFHLGKSHADPFVQCQQELLGAQTLPALDMLELTFRYIDRVIRHAESWDREHLSQLPDDAIQELNHRFREHALGYRYEAGELIRVDSEFIHEHAVKPAIAALQNDGFSGALQEFMKAHEHYRKGAHKEAIAEALKSFESTMKAICDARKWPYAQTATASTLIEVIFSQQLIPSELATEFTSLQAMLRGGLPTVRNRNSGHGQGALPRKVPDHLAGFALHLAAANITFLMAAHRAMK